MIFFFLPFSFRVFVPSSVALFFCVFPLSAGPVVSSCPCSVLARVHRATFHFGSAFWFAHKLLALCVCLKERANVEARLHVRVCMHTGPSPFCPYLRVEGGNES